MGKLTKDATKSYSKHTSLESLWRQGKEHAKESFTKLVFRWKCWAQEVCSYSLCWDWSMHLHYIPEMGCILIGLASTGSSLMLHLTDDALLEGWQLLPGQHLAEVEVWCQQQGRVQFKVSISLVHTHTHTVCLLKGFAEGRRKAARPI